MAGSANDLLRSRNAEKLQPGTKNRHRTQLQTNRVHILVGENGHAKSLICHTEWSDQRQENDVIELIRAPFHVADLSSETFHVIGRMSAFRSTRSFSCLSNFIHPDNTRIWDTFTACVSRPIVRNRSGRHTLHDIIRLHRRAPFTLFQTSPFRTNDEKSATRALMIAFSYS